MTLIRSSIRNNQGIESESDLVWRCSHYRVVDRNSSVIIPVHQPRSIPIPNSLHHDWSIHHIAQIDATGKDEVQALEETGIPGGSRDDGRWRNNCGEVNESLYIHRVTVQ